MIGMAIKQEMDEKCKENNILPTKIHRMFIRAFILHKIIIIHLKSVRFCKGTLTN